VVVLLASISKSLLILYIQFSISYHPLTYSTITTFAPHPQIKSETQTESTEEKEEFETKAEETAESTGKVTIVNHTDLILTFS